MMMMIRTQTWLCLGVSGVELMECYGTPYLEKEHPPFLDALPMENFVYLKFPRYLWQHVFFCRKTYQVHHFFREKVGCPHIAIFLVKSMVFGVAFLFWVNTPSLGHESSSFLPSSWERFFFLSSPKTSKINNIWETHRQNTADFSMPVPWDSHRPARGALEPLGLFPTGWGRVASM